MQTLSMLKKISDQYNKQFEKIEFAPIQKAYTSPHYLGISVRFPGKTVNLLIGRGQRYEGIEFSLKNIPSLLRQQDKFLDFIRKNLIGKKMGKIVVDPQKRRIRIPILSMGHLSYFDLMWLDRELYFSWQTNLDEGFAIFRSWSGESRANTLNSLDEIFKDFTHQIDPTDHASTEQFEYLGFDMKAYLKSCLVGHANVQSPQKKKKFNQRKKENIQKDIKRFEKRIMIKDQLLNEQVVLDGQSFDLCGVKVKFKEEDSYYKKRDLVFTKIKSLDKAVEILQKRLFELSKVVSEKENEEEVGRIKLPVVQVVWDNSKKQKTKITASDFSIVTYELPSKIRVSVSLNAQSNDELRKNANKDHYWFHIDQIQGSHAIAKTDRFDQLSEVDLKLIGSLLAHHSKYPGSEADIIFATVKELRGVKGAAGKVTVKKPKYLRIQTIPEWEKMINLLG